MIYYVVFFKQKTSYEMRISDWSSDVCSSDLPRPLEGDDIDLEACTETLADMLAGLPMPQALYKQQRPQRRDMAITLLIDISGSTDSWLSADQRIIDVEREALLLVGIALERLGEPYSIQAFSGEGPNDVTISPIKAFTEPKS